jgi:branched-chain amino acid transport system substrate-binding protein
MKRPIRTAAVLLTLLLAAACGQKANINANEPTPAANNQHFTETEPPANLGDEALSDPGAANGVDTMPSAASAPGVAAVPGATGATPSPRAATNSPAATPVPPPAEAAGTPETTVTTRTAAAGPPPAPAPETPAPRPPAPAPAPVGPVDRTGVAETRIRIGLHAPLTGAAPFPESAFDKGKDVYWKHVAESGGIFGRNVEVVFRDDQFNPSRAVQVCRELVEQEKVFAIIGVAGSEQITSCGRYADAAGVPYFSGGVNEEGLKGLHNYFAFSQTYMQQTPTLVSLIQNRLRKTKIAIVLNSTPALNETQQDMTVQARAAGLNIVRNSRIGKNASDSELISEANALRTSGAEVVYIVTSPINFIKLATNAQAQAFSPTYVGPGVTNGLNIVAQAGCPGIGAAKFLSPFPQLDAIDRLDPDYQKAYQKYNGSDGDDVGILEWGLSKVLGRILEATGRDLSRQSLEATMMSGKEFNSNVYPVVSYSGSIRFGAKSSHLLEADCVARRYRTVATFATGF